MARTFRKVGMQFATQFAYDPMYIAPFNTEYQTHYLNLAYAPQKALGMKIAADAFRRVPRNKDYGRYPGNTRFAGVRVSYADDLAEFVSTEKFFYSGTTATQPPTPRKLTNSRAMATHRSSTIPVWGRTFSIGSSLACGVSRSCRMRYGFAIRSRSQVREKRVARIAWNEWPIRIDLPDLGAGFAATGLNDGNGFVGHADGTTFQAGPGVYLLDSSGRHDEVEP